MIKSSTNPSINSNTFTRSRTIQRQGIPIPIAGTTSTDLALYSSTGYSVVDNVFIGYSSQSGYGTIIDYSNFPGNTAGNEINRNQYDTYSHVGTFHLGSSYYHVGGAAIQAQENNSGLQIHCNQNGQSIGTGHNPNYNDIVAAASTTNTIPPTTIPPIASIQGNCSTPTSTAGNTFSTCSSSTNDNLYSNLFSYKYNYNPNSSFVPTCYSSIITPSNCGPPSDPYSTVCPDPLASSCGNGSYVTCRAVHAALKKTHDSSQAVIDSGNASKLFHILSIGTPAQIQDSLLAAGPYLSDSLLLATIANSLPFDTLKNILEPNAPLTSRVVEAAYALIGLPGNIRDSLEAAQLGGPSARRQLNESIIYYSNETDIAANSILREYMADTTINGIDSSLAFLKTISGVPSLAQQANLNMLKSSFDSAKNLVDSINTLGQMKDFCSLSTVLIQLADSGKNIFQMTTIQYDTVSGIAHRPVISQSTLNARAILAEVYNISIPDTILPILDSVSGHRAIKPNTSKNSMDSIAEGSIKLYPNPANNKLNIAYNLDNNLVSNLVIYDLMGNKITEYILPQNVSMVSENISNLPAGFYVYCVETGNKIVQRGKFVVVR
jgi:hypothetical protein